MYIRAKEIVNRIHACNRTKEGIRLFLSAMSQIHARKWAGIVVLAFPR